MEDKGKGRKLRLHITRRRAKIKRKPEHYIPVEVYDPVRSKTVVAVLI